MEFGISCWSEKKLITNKKFKNKLIKNEKVIQITILIITQKNNSSILKH